MKDKLSKEITIKDRHMLEIKLINLGLERIRYMKNADKKCRTRENLIYSWPPTLEKTGRQVSDWKRNKVMTKEERSNVYISGRKKF